MGTCADRTATHRPNANGAHVGQHALGEPPVLEARRHKRRVVDFIRRVILPATAESDVGRCEASQPSAPWAQQRQLVSGSWRGLVLLRRFVARLVARLGFVAALLFERLLPVPRQRWLIQAAPRVGASAEARARHASRSPVRKIQQQRAPNNLSAVAARRKRQARSTLAQNPNSPQHAQRLQRTSDSICTLFSDGKMVLSNKSHRPTQKTLVKTRPRSASSAGSSWKRGSVKQPYGGGRARRVNAAVRSA